MGVSVSCEGVSVSCEPISMHVRAGPTMGPDGPMVPGGIYMRSGSPAGKKLSGVVDYSDP